MDVESKHMQEKCFGFFFFIYLLDLIINQELS